MSGSPSISAVSAASFRFGWWMLLVFIALGALLEALHGFKVGFYLDSDQQIRRSMWRLAHAHGTGLSLLNIVFGATLAAWNQKRRVISLARWLMVATLLIPFGFFGAGLFATKHAAGGPLVLLPAGAISLIAVVTVTAWWTSSEGRSAKTEP